MVTMVPPRPKPGTNKSETRLFDAFDAAIGHDDWVVLHSVDVFQNIFKLENEIDFVVLVPGKGIVVVERKAPKSVDYVDGDWHLDGVPNPGKDPLHQVSRARDNIRAYLNRNDLASDIPIARLLWFTSLHRYQLNIQKPEDITFFEWELALADDMAKPIETIERVLAEHTAWYSKAQDLSLDASSFTVEAVEHVRRSIVTSFKSKTTKADRYVERAGEANRMLEQQIAQLDLIETNPHIYFEGSAGTGKTFMLTEIAIRKSRLGQRTLLTCWNYMLAEQLQSKYAGRLNMDVIDINRLMLNIVGRLDNPKKASSEWYEVTLPNEAIAMIKANPGKWHYDVICVDEFQDIAQNEAVLEFLFRLGKPNYLETQLYFAGDRVQRIMGGGPTNDPYKSLKSLIPDLVNARLRINCRNDPSIAGKLQGILRMPDIDFARFRLPTSETGGLEVRHIRGEDQAKALEAAIEDVLQEFRHEDIRILSPFGENRSLLGKLFKRESASKAERYLKKHCKHTSNDGKIRWRSIAKFKGLESEAVIITDINQEAADSLAARGHSLEELLYVGITRAKYRCIVLVSDKVSLKDQ